MRRRQSNAGRGYLVQFEARMSQTAAKADEWIPIKPGTEGLVALAIGRLVAEARGGHAPDSFRRCGCGLPQPQLPVSAKRNSSILRTCSSKAKAALAIPGGAALGQSNGLETAEAVLALNALVGELGTRGGVFLSPLAPMQTDYQRPASLQEMSDFVEKMKAGEIKVLFVHGVNPVFELPKSLGFESALKSVPRCDLVRHLPR